MKLSRPLALALFAAAATGVPVSGVSAATAHSAAVKAPNACGKAEGYSEGKQEWAEVKICLTEEKKPDVKKNQNNWQNAPADTIIARCSHKDATGMWTSNACRVLGHLTMAKPNGDTWTEERKFETDPRHGIVDGKIDDFYACKGTGEYTLKLHDTVVLPTDKNEVWGLHVATVTIKAKGC